MIIGRLKNSIDIDIPKPNREGDPLEVAAEIRSEENGVYAFYSETKELLYVGKSSDLKSRILKHIKHKSTNTKEYAAEFYSIKIWIFEDETDIDIFETYLINTLKPKYNQSKTYYKKDSELEQIIQSVSFSDYDIGQTLRWYREHHGLSRKQLSRILQISYSTYANYENNKTPIPIHFLVVIADIFKTSLDELIGRRTTY